MCKKICLTICLCSFSFVEASSIGKLPIEDDVFTHDYEASKTYSSNWNSETLDKYSLQYDAPESFATVRLESSGGVDGIVGYAYGFVDKTGGYTINIQKASKEKFNKKLFASLKDPTFSVFLSQDYLISLNEKFKLLKDWVQFGLSTVARHRCFESIWKCSTNPCCIFSRRAA